jgi:biopolymer transport protein ExbD
MRRFSQRSSLVTLSEINITPLLDLAFVLLIIFVITTPLLEQALPLNLPKGGQPEPRIEKKDIRTVEIGAQGGYVLDRRPMKIDQIESELVKDFRANPKYGCIYSRGRDESLEGCGGDSRSVPAEWDHADFAANGAAENTLMNRLQKKCFIGSAGLHLLLVLILFVGPAFLSPKSKSQEYVVLTVIPLLTTDGFTGGGNPNVKLPPPPPPVREPTPPTPQRRLEPDPPKPPPEPKAEQESFDLKPDKPKKPAVSTKPVVRNSNNSKPTAKQRTMADVQDRQVADHRRQVANLISKTAQNAHDASSTSVEMPSVGPGSGKRMRIMPKLFKANIFTTGSCQTTLTAITP